MLCLLLEDALQASQPLDEELVVAIVEGPTARLLLENVQKKALYLTEEGVELGEILLSCDAQAHGFVESFDDVINEAEMGIAFLSKIVLHLCEHLLLEGEFLKNSPISALADIVGSGPEKVCQVVIQVFLIEPLLQNGLHVARESEHIRDELGQVQLANQKVDNGRSRDHNWQVN